MSDSSVGTQAVTPDELYLNQQSPDHTLNVELSSHDLQYREPPLNLDIQYKHVLAAISALASAALISGGIYVLAETPYKLLGTPLLAAGLGAGLARGFQTLIGVASEKPLFSAAMDVTLGLGGGWIGMEVGIILQARADQAHAPAPAPWH